MRTVVDDQQLSGQTFSATVRVDALEWWLSGLIDTRQNLKMWGFDYFSMNLNAFFNSYGRSRVLPPLPLGGGQYEGFMYLGLGMIGLSLVSSALVLRGSARTAPKRVFQYLRASGHLPLAFVALCFALYALGRIVTFQTRCNKGSALTKSRSGLGTSRSASAPVPPFKRFQRRLVFGYYCRVCRFAGRVTGTLP
jgi:hypothetical protein